MLTVTQARVDLLKMLRSQSVTRGDFALSSGGRSSYYVDCKMTTLDPKGAWLAGRVMHALIRDKERELAVQLNGVGGLTLGADPIAIATGMVSYEAGDEQPFRMFVVRKAPKAHGQTKLIEGNFQPGNTVAVIDDVVTRGDSTIKAIEAVRAEGGIVSFAAVLVDRQEGGRQRIEAMGLPVVAAFTRDELLGSD